VKIGDRVEIVSLRHPWVGWTGRIVERFNYPMLQWTVWLEDDGDPGMKVAAHEADLKVI
jgi:hypothetical protein